MTKRQKIRVAITHGDRSELKYRLWQLLSFVTSGTFLVIALCVGGAVIVYIVVTAYCRGDRRVR